MAGHGGKRPGAGRPQRAKNRATLDRERAIAESGLTPLDLILCIMRDETQELQTRLDAARAAAPFVHPRLAQMGHSGSIALTHEEAIAQLE